MHRVYFAPGFNFCVSLAGAGFGLGVVFSVIFFKSKWSSALSDSAFKAVGFYSPKLGTESYAYHEV